MTFAAAVLAAIAVSLTLLGGPNAAHGWLCAAIPAKSSGVGKLNLRL
jgi:hypothetical protein